MALQSPNLVMVGLGVENDQPPDALQPPLLDGIHLRWAFAPADGFPWHGFYLFRRTYKRGDPVCLSPATLGLRRGPVGGSALDTLYGRVHSDQSLELSDDFPTPPAGGPLEFDLDHRAHLRFTPPGGAPARLVEVQIGFRTGGRVEVTALLRGTPVATTVIKGGTNDVRTATLEFDAITEVELVRRDGSAALVELCYVPVAQDATANWQPAPNVPAPLTLPLTHPDYPPTAAQQEDLKTARQEAEQRVRYGQAAPWTTAAGPSTQDGRVTVTAGSPLVSGQGTTWKPTLVGQLLAVDGDSTAYTIAAVPASDRLVLSRSYDNASQAGVSYEIRRDAFGELHDQLIHLVAGGPGTTPMAHRTLPQAVTATGTIDLRQGDAVVFGQGTAWTAALAGLGLQVQGDSRGSVAVSGRSPIVTGSGTAWSADLRGASFRLAGEERVYTVAAVGPGQQLTLDRPYEGTSGGGRAYRLYDPTVYTITQVSAATKLQLDRPYRGNSVGSRPYVIIPLLAAAASSKVPSLLRQRPLDLVLLAALEPAIAEIAGLAWVDEKAETGFTYDYLLIADRHGIGAGSADRILTELRQNGFLQLDGTIVFKQSLGKAPQLAAPAAPRAYALTGAGGATSNAGLRWDLGVTADGALLPGRAVRYHLWRRSLGNGDDPAAGGADRSLTKGAPVLVAAPRLPAGHDPERPRDWPPFPLHSFDRGLTDGWYSYRVTGIDIFGRHSPQSVPAAWHQWAPMPRPRPWYYQDPPDNRALHPTAIRFRNTAPPPPPTGIEAQALDPLDPTVLQDQAYTDWRASLEAAAWFQALSPAERDDLVGLRVRWLWTAAHQRQAPDTREFRIYFHPGTPNAQLGRTTDVVAVGDEIHEVGTDLDSSLAADAHAGAWLRVGNEAFRVVGNAAGTPLRLRVRGGPATGAGTVTVTQGSESVVGDGTAWRRALAGATLRLAGESSRYTVLAVDTAAQRLTLDRPYPGASAAGRGYAIVDRQPRATAPCSLAFPPPYGAGAVDLLNGADTVSGHSTDWTAGLAGLTFTVDGDTEHYRMVRVESPTRLVLDRPYAGNTATRLPYVLNHPLHTDFAQTTAWRERFAVVAYDEHVTEGQDDQGRPLRTYEIFLPVPSGAVHLGLPLVTSLATPVVYAQIGVSAADDQAATADNPQWSAPERLAGGTLGGRIGNEGPVGAAAPIFRVRRTPPPPPQPPRFDVPRVHASAADYHSRSFYTYRWAPQAGLRTHIFRALDDTLFQVDRAWRRDRNPPFVLLPDDPQHIETYFPVELRDNDAATAARRTAAAGEINALNALDPAADSAAARAAYQALGDDALRVLAGMVENEDAFAQLTVEPLDPEAPDPDDPAQRRWRNRRGPDDPDDFLDPGRNDPLADPALRVYPDTLDGRSSGRYLYRAAYVDGAHNRSANLSLATPPVYLPDVVPPRTPVLTEVFAGDPDPQQPGDRKITLRWASNREADLAAYQVYRTTDPEAGRDLRLMTRVHTAPVAAGDPLARPAAVQWIDDTVPGLVTHYYRVVAVDAAGHPSRPSAVLAARAFDEAPPLAPLPVAAWVERNTRTRAEITWTSTHEVLVQRREDAGPWIDLSQWRAAGTVTVRDPFSTSTQPYHYRLRARKTTGALATSAVVTLQAQNPGGN